MKAITTAAALAAVVVAGSLLTGADAPKPDAPNAGEMEITKDANLFLRAAFASNWVGAAPVGGITVYGVKLGDSIEKLPAAAALSRQPTERPQEAVLTGPNVSFFAFDGRIYRIRIHGELVKTMPPYNATRLQVLLGKADEVVGDGTYLMLSYFSRRVKYTFPDYHSHPIAVDFYAP